MPALKTENIASLVHVAGSERILFDADLAALYGVSTKALNAVLASRSQIVTLKRGQNIKYLPRAFTEQGVAMLSSVLRSPRAVEVNIAIMRTFVQLRRLMDSNRHLARKIESLEKRYDEQFAVVFHAIKRLITEEARARRHIGFVS